MRVVYAAENDSQNKLFYYKAKWFGNVYLIMPTDIYYIEGIESRVVRKIVRATYRDSEDRDFALYYKDQK
jgi:hypothetical protein